MDDKVELLKSLRLAKSAHIKWRSYAQGMVAGLAVTEDNAPVSHLSCKFGQWYYSAGRQKFAGNPMFDDIETPHAILHQVYEEIHRAVQARRMDLAKEKLADLVGISRTLIESIELLAEDVRDS